MSTPLVKKTVQQVLDKIQQAQDLLREAQELASPLQGWANERPKGPYYKIRDHIEATRKLWYQCRDAKEPTGHDHEKITPQDIAETNPPRIGHEI